MRSKADRLARLSRLFSPFKRSSLRTRMTASYLLVTLGSVLFFIMLGALASGAFSVLFADTVSDSFLAAMQNQAQSYALAAAVQAQGATFDPHTNFIPGQAHTLAFPNQENQGYRVFAPAISTGSPDPTSQVLALLVLPDGRLVVSSYPSRYPAGMTLAALRPDQMRAIEQALTGQTSTGIEHLSSATLGYVAEPVWNRDHHLLGAIFLQAPVPEQESIFERLGSGLLSNVILLILVTPVGMLFGWITTRELVRRVQQLVKAATQFASGEYSQRVAAIQQDEIGQLERQFNHMAEQLVENIARRQQLAEENARLGERSRISRELHDVISQDLFSLRMLADGLQEATKAGSSPTDLRPHIAMLEQTTSDMTREMRALLLELRPTQLENFGLADALQKLAHVYSTRLGITVTANVRPIALTVKEEHALLRIAQEALANAARHSNATLMSLSLIPLPQEVELTITDNGQGFAPEQRADRHGLGLHLMQERVQELQGIFIIKTAPEQGTCICVRLPWEGENDQSSAGR